MQRWIGLLGSWALFVLGLGLSSIAVAGEWINIGDSRKLQRYALIEELLRDRVAGEFAQLRQVKNRSESSLDRVRSEIAAASRTIYKTQDTSADRHYVELARKNGMSVVRLNPGQTIDADTGRAAVIIGGGVWDWIGESAGSKRMLKVKNDTVVEIFKGIEREVPPGSLIRAGNALVIPPVGNRQRDLDTALSDQKMVPEGKSEKPKESLVRPRRRSKRLQEKGESIFGRK